MDEVILAHLSFVLGRSPSQLDLSASFFELGGNSIQAVILNSKCQKDGVDLSIERIISCPSLSELFVSGSQNRKFNIQRPPLIRHGSSAYEQLDRNSSAPAYQQRYDPNDSDFSGCETPRGAKTASITEMQLMLIFGSQNDENTNIIRYHEEYRLSDLPAVRRAWHSVIGAEPIFRTTFDLASRTMLENSGPLPLHWSESKASTLEEYEITSTYNRGVDIDIVSGVSTSFHIKTFEQRGVFTITWNVHHALVDGCSKAIILDKVRRVASGESIEPGPSFVDWANAHHEYQQDNKQLATEFWRQQNDKYPSPSGSPSFIRPVNADRSQESNETSQLTLQIPYQELATAARKSTVTLATLFHGAWALVLSKYLSTDEVVFGTILSGRSSQVDDTFSTVGPMINTLPFNVKIDRTLSCDEFLRQILVQTMELISFEWTTPAAGFSRNFSTAMAVEVDQRPSRKEDYSVMPIATPQASILSEIPLHITVSPLGAVQINYHCHKYDSRDMQVLGTMLIDALHALTQPHAKLEPIMDSLLQEDTRRGLLDLGNAFGQTTRTESNQDSLVTLFKKAAAEYPAASACQLGDEQMSYMGLDSASDKVAQFIDSQSLKGEVVCLQPSSTFNWIIGIYGILKAGAVYCPLDGSLPPAIRDDYFSISTSRTLLIAGNLDSAHKPTGCQIFESVESIVSTATSTSPYNPSTLPQLDNAYLCFTSGSTGKPKGVMCTHQGLVAFQKDLEVRLFASPGIKVSQLMSPVFDGSIHEIFSALSYGGTLMLSQASNPFAVLQSVDSAILTPTIAKVLDPSDYPTLKYVYLVGEPVPQNVNDHWAAHVQLYNMYGPTEGTCGATIKKLEVGQRVTLGAPNPSTRIYILDKERNLCPPGVVGEICLAGVQIAKGYIGRPGVTAKSFLPDPILPETHERMYCTGDLGSWNSEGEIECLGRIDRQVKLQGFRLNLNDLETRVQRAVQEVDAIAIARKGDALVAMAQSKRLTPDKLRKKLSAVLPPYARPRHLAVVERLPMTAAGKVDYQSVIKDTTRSSSSAPLRKSKSEVQSTTDLKNRLAATWIQVLGLSSSTKIDDDSDFIELGGSSIQQLHLSVELSRQFSCRVPLQTIVQNPMLLDLTSAVRSIVKSGTKSANSEAFSKNAISPMEREWCERYASTACPSTFNVSYACKIDNTVDRMRLATSWNKVLARYPVLRSLYRLEEGQYVRRYSKHIPRARRFKSLKIEREVNRPFVIDAELPIRVLISRRTMLIVASHIICDLTTVKTLLNEMSYFYNGKRPELANREYIRAPAWSAPVSTSALEFWPEYLGDKAHSHEAIVCDNKRQAPSSGTSFVTRVPGDLYERMKSFVADTKFTYHQLALAAVALTLDNDGNGVDTTLGAPFMNRPTAEDMDTIGLFLEPLPVRVHSSADGSSLMESVKKSSQAALAHPVPWHQLLRRMGRIPNGANQQLFDTMVTFLEQGQMPLSPIEGLHPLYTWAEGAKFKLMVEFLAMDADKLMLRLEYDTNEFTQLEVSTIQKRLLAALDGIISGHAVETISTNLTNIDGHENEKLGGQYFAQPFECI